MGSFLTRFQHRVYIIGYPAPTVEWFIDEDQIPEDDDYYQMTVTAGVARLYMALVDVHDEGEYMMVATNEFGSASTTCELTLTGMPP